MIEEKSDIQQVKGYIAKLEISILRSWLSRLFSVNTKDEQSKILQQATMSEIDKELDKRNNS